MSAKVAKKIAQVIGKTKHVEKRGHNTGQGAGYKYATAEDIAAECRVAMAEVGLIMIVDPIDRHDEDISSSKGNAGTYISMKYQVTMFDADSDECLQFHVFSDASDYSDKAVYKAQTGAIKAALRMIFLLPTGDDPDKDHNEGARNKRGARQSGDGNSDRVIDRTETHNDKPASDDAKAIVTARKALTDTLTAKAGNDAKALLVALTGKDSTEGMSLAALNEWTIQAQQLTDEDVARKLQDTK